MDCEGTNLSGRRKILALLFEVIAESGDIRSLIAWLDETGNSRFLYPVHPERTLLDVTAGDALIYKREIRLVVRRLKPWRTSECKDETAYQEVICGRDWEADERMTGSAGGG